MSDTGLPQSFPTRTLAQIASRITDGSHFSPTPQRQGHLIANVKDMRSGQIDFDGCTRISSLAFRELKATGCVIRNGDVLLSKDGTVGRVVVYESDQEIGALSSICLITPQDGQDPRFLGHALQSHDCVRQYENAMSGSALRRLVLRDIRQIRVPTPTVDEQAKVAQVLDTLDTTIRQTEAIIEKLKQVKQGLLHDLLTRGIDANGELRPPQSQAPHLYKDSPLGWIPREWGASMLNELTEPDSPITYGVVKPGPEVDGGVAFVRGGDIYGGRVLVEQLRTIGQSVSREYRRTLLRGGELLMSLVGYPGEVAVVPSSLAGANIARQAALIRLRAPTNALYVMHYLASPVGKRQVLASSLGSAQQVVNLGDLRSVFVPLATASEQELICEHLAAAIARVDKENNGLSKLREVKFGLMDDLLTGRVRVTPLLQTGATTP